MKNYILLLIVLTVGAFTHAQEFKIRAYKPVLIITYQWQGPSAADSVFKDCPPDSVLNYFTDKGIRPNSMITYFRVLQHVYGADAYKTIFIMEIDKFENIDRSMEKTVNLINSSFKTEKESALFWKRWGMLYDRHEDSIMSDMVKPKQ